MLAVGDLTNIEAYHIELIHIEPRFCVLFECECESESERERKNNSSESNFTFHLFRAQLRICARIFTHTLRIKAAHVLSKLFLRLIFVWHCLDPFTVWN